MSVGVCRPSQQLLVTTGHDERKKVPQLPPSPPTSVTDSDAKCPAASGVDRSCDGAKAEADNPSLLRPRLPSTSGTHTQGFRFPRLLRLGHLGRRPITTPSRSHCLRSQGWPWKTQHKPKTDTASVHPWIDHTTLL